MKNITAKIKPSILYYPIVLLGYVLTLFIPSIRMGVFSAILLLIVTTEIGLKIIKSDNRSDFISVLNISVFVYVIYNFFSFIWIMKNGYPISIYVEEFSNSILPAVFYFVAVVLFSGSDKEKENTDSFYKAFLFAYTIYCMLCIIMYLWAPQFYCDFLYNMSYISLADKPTCRVRMEGFFGSTCLSFLAVVMMIIAAKYMYSSFVRSGLSTKSDIKNKREIINFIVYSVLFVFAFAVVFMANGRAGMVVAILVIIYINFLMFFSFEFLEKKYLYFEMGAVILIIVIMCIITPDVAGKIWARLISLPGAIGQRSEQWIAALNNMYGQWFGNGLGANGHKAINVEGAHPVPDGGLIKLYCEEGAIGFSIFVYIMILSIRNGIKSLKESFAEIAIVVSALLMSIGSNVIAFQLCMPVFWFAVGAMGLKKQGTGSKKNQNWRRI